MQLSSKIYLLAFLSLLAFVGVFSFGNIPQSTVYHNFCDTRSFAGIPNFVNVISNIAFIITGVAGLFLLRRSAAPPAMTVIYFSLCIGILLTGLGSAYYHLTPDNETLVFDRLPMTMVFMSLVAAIAGESISPAVGIILLPPLVLAGIGSVVWWHYTEAEGAGDLRPYVLVQYYPMVLIPAILILFPPKNKKGIWLLVGAFIWYFFAKILEHFDCGIYSYGHVISGHSLKHVAAAISTWRLVKRSVPILPPSAVRASGEPGSPYDRPGHISDLR